MGHCKYVANSTDQFNKIHTGPLTANTGLKDMPVRDNLRNYTSDLHQLYVAYGRGSILLWRHSDTLHISGFMDDVIFAHKLRLLDVAARLRQRQWGSYAALGLTCGNTCCRQRTLGTTCWSQGLLLTVRAYKAAVGMLNIYDIMFAYNAPAHTVTRKWRVIKVYVLWSITASLLLTNIPYTFLTIMELHITSV